MNLFGRMLLKMIGESYSVDDPRISRIISGGVTTAGTTVNDTSAMSLSAAWCCVRILSETLGTLPWAVFEDGGDGKLEKVKDHHLARVLVDSPNANMTSVEYRESQGYNLCLGGNAYSFKDTSRSGEVVALTPIEYEAVQPKQRDDGTVFYKVNDRGRWEEYPQEKIWHVKGFGRNGLMGLSPLAFERQTMGAALAQEEFGARFFAQGGFPSGIVTTDKQFKDKETRDIARESLNQMMGGLGNSHKFALFENGMKPEPWNTMPLEDMQFILSRKFSIQEICRFYRIPPHMVADLDRATFSNIEHLSQEFVMFTLMPYLTRIESSASKWLLRPGERQRYYLRFNYEGLLRADSAGRAAFYSTMLQNGVMNRNEARAKENMNRSDAEGMDDYTVQLNLAPIGELGKVLAAGGTPRRRAAGIMAEPLKQ